jgi:hypothetical protein
MIVIGIQSTLVMYIYMIIIGIPVNISYIYDCHRNTVDISNVYIYDCHRNTSQH